MTSGPLFLLGAALVFSGCVSQRPKDETPDWFKYPRKHDEQHLFFTAKGESALSIQQARQNAARAIKSDIGKYIVSEVKVVEDATASRVSIESAVELREVETFKEHHARIGRQWVVWMLGSFSRVEYDRIQSRLEAGVRLEEKWRKAQSEINRDAVTSGEQGLHEIIYDYDKALRVSFDLEAVKLSLAALYRKQAKILKARQWATDVQKTTTSPEWRRRVDDFLRSLPPVPLGDVFDGQTVGIFCCARRDGHLSLHADLAHALNTHLARHGIRTVTAHESILVDGMIFDDEVRSRVTALLRSQSADVAFVFLLDVDSGKTGKKVPIPGSTAQMDVHDALLTYWIVRATDGRLLASDSTSGFSHAPAGMLNAVLTHKRHLPSHVANIAEGLDAK